MKDMIALSMLLITLALSFSGCSKSKANTEANGDTVIYEKITAEEALEMMEQHENDDYVLLDVRTPEEYESGHIEGALLIPDYELKDRADSELKDKSKTIFLYCRSGNRSASAAKRLKDLGYTSIYDFGGIINWPYDIVNSD